MSEISYRYLSDMHKMFELPTGFPVELYKMERGVNKYLGMRRDLTTIHPRVINGHYNKTKGHIHKSGHDEIYRVLAGRAIFLFQKGKQTWHRQAATNEVVFIPGDAYHVTINPSQTVTLELENWIDKECVSDYSYLEKMNGMAWYYTLEGWKRNPSYPDEFELNI